MSRMPLTFACQRHNCAGTLDSAPGRAGLLIVSGGNEIRSGAFQNQSRLAAEIAQAGFPVFRFDRRGVGDSEGENRGFQCSTNDIGAAREAFRVVVPHLDYIVGFGNCDAASALMLAQGAGCDALVLSNPWTIEDDDGSLAPEAVRSRYLEKLKNPREIARLVRGQINLGKLASGIAQSLKPSAPPTSLAQDMAAGLAQYTGHVDILLAEKDRTAQAFAANWDTDDRRLATCPDATHAYVEPDAQQWLHARLLKALRRRISTGSKSQDMP